MSGATPSVDLVALVRDLAARPRSRAPGAASLRGLNGAWRKAEQALVADASAAPRRADRLVGAFVRLARIAGDDEARGRAARVEGWRLAATGRWEESLGAYERAASFLAGTARDGARLGLASSLLRCGRHAEAEKLCAAIRRAALRRGERAVAAAADLNAGVARHEGGDPAAALPLYRRALRGFAAAGDARGEAKASLDLANALVLLDRHDEAAPLYEQAIAAYGRLGLAREAALARYNRGALLCALDRLGEAEAELADAEEALRSLGDSAHAALCRLDRGEVLLRARLLPEARETLRSVRRQLGRAVPAVERARAVLLLARAELALGDAEAARRLLRARLPIETAALAAERTELTGRAAALAGRPREARALLDRAAAQNGRARPAARSRALAAAAWCALESGDGRGARRRAADAARIAARLRIPGLEHAAHAVAFLVEVDGGRRRAADESLRRALEALERIRAGLGPDALRAAVLRGSDAWFARAVRYRLERDPGTRGETAALALLERWRARGLVDLLGDARRTGTSGDATQHIDALRARVAAVEGRLEGATLPAFLRTGAGPAPRGLVRALAVAERRLREAFRSQPGGDASPPQDLAKLAAGIPDGTVLVALHADAGAGRAFVVARDGVRVVGGLAPEPETARLVEELHFRLGKFTLGPEFASRHTRRLARETEEILRALAEGTLAPIEDALRGARRLVVVPHGAWQRVPFAALPRGDGRLADALTVAATPLLGSLALRVPAARGPSLVLAVGDARAPAIVEEGRAVARALPEARLLEGDAARSDALRSGPAAACVHLAAHGRFRHDAPALSGVRLADGWLHAAVFRHLALAGSVVVLSGCDTGIAGADACGEGMGLVRGALAGGAAEVVVSLWRVEDAFTARLMERLHRLRASGLGTEEALRRAQCEASSQGLHPWYWAGFVVWTRRLGAADGGVPRRIRPPSSP